MKKKKNEQTEQEVRPNTDDTNTNQPNQPKEKVEKTPTVIERPETPVGGFVKSTGKNSPSQKKTKG